MTPLLALLMILRQDAGGDDIPIVEPRRASWARPSNITHFTERRIAGWRVRTWTDSAGDRIVRLQRWLSRDTLIYERWYRPGEGMFDSAEVVVGNCAQGDPVVARGSAEPSAAQVRAALQAHLARCQVGPRAAARMLGGFDRAYPVVIARGRATAEPPQRR